jgi:hypothetical protein
MNYDFRHVLCAASLALFVYGCGQKPEPKMPEQASSSASEAPKPIPLVLPERKAGLWDISIKEEASTDTPRRFKLCIDKPTDETLGILLSDLSADKCSRLGVNKNPDGSWAVLRECNMGSGGINTYSGTISGDYATDYSMSLRAQTIGASVTPMNRVSNLLLSAKRISACMPAQKGGDMIEAGVTINLFDMAGLSR